MPICDHNLSQSSRFGCCFNRDNWARQKASGAIGSGRSVAVGINQDDPFLLMAPACCYVNAATCFGNTTFLAKNSDEHHAATNDSLKDRVFFLEGNRWVVAASAMKASVSFKSPSHFQTAQPPSLRGKGDFCELPKKRRGPTLSLHDASPPRQMGALGQ